MSTRAVIGTLDHKYLSDKAFVFFLGGVSSIKTKEIISSATNHVLDPTKVSVIELYSTQVIAKFS